MSTSSLRKYNEANESAYNTFDAPTPDDQNQINDKNQLQEIQIEEPVPVRYGFMPGYPKIVFLIILNEFCERFSFYGLKTVLYIYFTDFIKLDKDTATAIYHAYSMFCYFTPIIG